MRFTTLVCVLLLSSSVATASPPPQFPTPTQAPEVAAAAGLPQVLCVNGTCRIASPPRAVGHYIYDPAVQNTAADMPSQGTRQSGRKFRPIRNLVRAILGG